MDEIRITLHPDTQVAFEDLGKVNRPYLPTHTRFVDHIDDFHRSLATAPRNGILIDLGISGWLRPADALKLYELAFYSRGDVLELGTNRGLSAYVMATALRNAGNGHRLRTVDLNDAFIALAQATIRDKGLGDIVDFSRGDATQICKALIADGKRFDLVFVDHSHAYQPVADICALLPELVHPGGFVVFHDYTDKRNTFNKSVGESDDEYGIFAAVNQKIFQESVEFCGVYGCCAVFVSGDKSRLNSG